MDVIICAAWPSTEPAATVNVTGRVKLAIRKHAGADTCRRSDADQNDSQPLWYLHRCQQLHQGREPHVKAPQCAGNRRVATTRKPQRGPSFGVSR